MGKKILIDGRMYGLENSGIGRYVANLIKELKTLSLSDKRYEKFNFVVLLRKKYYNQLKFPKNWNKILSDIKHYTIDEQIKIPFIIHREKPSLVHFPHFNVPMFYNGDFVVTIHDMIMHFQGKNSTTLPFYRYLIKRIPYKIIFRNSILRAKKIFVPSKVIKKQILSYFGVEPSKVVVVPEGVQRFFLERKRLEKKLLGNFNLKHKNYFFYVGNAYPHKNLELAVRAVKKLNETKKMDALLVIAGIKDSFKSRLKGYIVNNNAQRYVRILGFVKDSDLRVLYQNSLAFLYPSLSEGFGLQGLEAMASGCLVIASDIPVFREVYKDKAFFFDPTSEESLIKVMEKIFKMPQGKRREYLKKGRDFAKEFSWRRMAKETFRVYERVIEEKH